MPQSKSIRILIVDDQPVIREGLRGFLGIEPGLTLVGEAADGIEAVEKARSLQPDVILMDLVMPRKDGIEAIDDIIQENAKARILVLTSFDDAESVFSAIKAGALGYLIKNSSPEELISAIHAVHAGRLSLDSDVALKMIRELNQPSDLPPTGKPLTEREMDTLRLIARGLTNQEIAEALTVSERTVGKHVSNILSKLHLANRTQAALYALRQGLANLDPD